MNGKQKWTGVQMFLQGLQTSEFFYQPENSAAIRDVMREWQQAYALWQMVCDPDLIDAAIFRINAAEKQYVYLKKQEEKRQEEQAAQQSVRPEEK